ncbi:DUF2971 domain-containing protein [Epibacterium sp. SM1969]|uniref:DUF2971 domain-containing protein n=1 Tax=Tritonibacter aquimaris TaxID=2663379 RepID=A0A844AYD4_9RHOB|nr:DUF2971 domain-containing protein [Tritonibacter aquimaris]MQY43354.1 DUF2971 domain-containing protein [Tritonibacter aquimaris]
MLPDRLYRYRSTSPGYFTDELKHLVDNKVWLNFICKQNDPFEGTLRFDVETAEQFTANIYEYKCYLEEKYSLGNLLPDQVTETDISRSHLELPLFGDRVAKDVTQASFNRSWKNPLMWAHYANSYSGICLEFEKDLKRLDVVGPPILQVQYWSDQPPIYSPSEFYVHMKLHDALQNGVSDFTLNERFQTHRSDIAAIAREKMELAVLSKAAVWRYEEEFRMVSPSGNCGYSNVPGYRLSGVIFGNRAGDGLASQVIDVLGPELNYSRLELAGGQYGFRRVDLPGF